MKTMDKTKIATLNNHLKTLQEKYKAVVIDYLTLKDEHLEKMHELSNEIHATEGEIRRLRMPVGVEE